LSEFEHFRNEFNNTSKGEFLLSLTDSSKKLERLKKIGFNDDDILRLKNKRLPEGYQVHHKMPYDCNGSNDFSNFVLIQENPYRQAIFNYYNEFVKEQVTNESASLELPVPEGFFYPLVKE